jgi:hypothetical protein
MLPVANHLPLRIENPRQKRTRSRIPAPVREFARGLLSTLLISAVIITLSIALVCLICAL